MYGQDTTNVGTEKPVKTTDDSMDIYNMDLESLMNMNIEVTVASKKAEKISDAPGMVTVHTKNDMENYGYYTLKDLANITSGYSTFSAFGETNMETRGQKAGSWNVSKHLLLVDGIPMNHSRANSAPLENQMSLYFADRVEFLKGPGSALYGTSAFYGVVSVTPKSLKDNGSMGESKISFGDLGQSTRVMANALKKDDIGEMRISGSLYKKNFSGDSLGTTNNGIFHFNNDNSIFLNTAYKFTDTKLKGLGVGLVYMRRNSHAGEFWGATPSPVNEVTWEEFIPYLKYQRKLSNKLSFNSYLKYNASKEQSTYGASWNSFVPGHQPYNAYDYTTTNVEALTELTYQINESSSIIGGINYDTRQEVNDPVSYGYDITNPVDTSVSKSFTFNHTNYDGTIRVNVASAYAQYRKEFGLLNGLILTAGGRFDYGFSEAAKYTQFSPRVALVQRLTDHLNVKVLYGQAIRVPGVKELGLNSETIDGINENGGTGNSADIPDVGAEVIKSIEGGVNYNTNKFSAALAAFYNTTTDALDSYQYAYTDKNGNELAPNYFNNATGQINANGIELDLKYAFNENFLVMANHSFAKAVINDTIDFVDVPTQKTNGAITFVLPGNFRLVSTAVVRHMWGMTVIDGAYDESIVEMNSSSEVSGYTMLDLNFQVPIIEQFGLEFQIRNVFDTKWKQPSLLGQSSMVPLQGRNFMATVYAKF
jgi:outer membrane receptor protein involved in Fe transport